MKRSLFIALVVLYTATICAQELRIDEKKEFPRVSRVIDAKFSPFRNYYALTKFPYTLEIYDRNWDRIFKHQGSTSQGAGEIAFSPDENFLAFGSYKGINDIAIIRLKDLKVTQVLRGHSYRINDLQFSFDGNFLASVSYDQKLVIWKIENDNFIKHQVFEDYEDQVSNLAFSYDDKYLLTTDNDGYIRIYIRNNDKYELNQTIRNKNTYIYGLDYHPQKHEFITGGSSGLYRYSIKKNLFVPLDSITKGISVNNDINYSPAGELVTVPHSQDIRIFSTAANTITEIDGIYRHSWTTLAARFSNDGQFLSTCAMDSALIIWEISPVMPSNKSLIASWVGDKLTSAQRKILTYDVVIDLYNRVDESMVSPRDEFETTAAYNQRRSSLEDWTLSLIQKKTEEKYRLKDNGSGKVSIPLQEVIGYNADKQIYKVRFMETEAGVEIPVNDAIRFKNSWEKASVTANRNRKEGYVSYSYSNYQLEVPGISATFQVTPIENPFNHSDSRAGVVESGKSETMENSQENLTTDSGVITHALLFATNVYDSFSDLVNPILDANTISAELEENYGVHTEVVTNATLTQTAEKIREYASRGYTENENLIIFFAGHGIYDEIFKEGYVISTDSRADDISKTTYLSHSNLRTMVNNIGCKQIFLVMDVCFGGTIDPYLASSSHRGSMEMYSDIPKEQFIERKTRYKTRLYLTSGGKEYVPDGRSGFHSPFARRFIEALRKYGGEDGILTTGEILQYVEKVNPQPRFGEFGDNEPGSDFIIISR